MKLMTDLGNELGLFYSSQGITWGEKSLESEQFWKSGHLSCCKVESVKQSYEDLHTA